MSSSLLCVFAVVVATFHAVTGDCNVIYDDYSWPAKVTDVCFRDSDGVYVKYQCDELNSATQYIKESYNDSDCTTFVSSEVVSAIVQNAVCGQSGPCEYAMIQMPCSGQTNPSPTGTIGCRANPDFSTYGTSKRYQYYQCNAASGLVYTRYSSSSKCTNAVNIANFLYFGTCDTEGGYSYKALYCGTVWHGPSEAPTAVTPSPTTEAPTSATTGPSSSPTTGPTSETGVPSASPTQQPTAVTAAPTVAPTSVTLAPSSETGAPTSVTLAPSSETGVPTATPSSSPTQEAIATVSPNGGNGYSIAQNVVLMVFIASQLM